MTIQEMEEHFLGGTNWVHSSYWPEIDKNKPGYFFQEDATAPAICYRCGGYAGKGFKHKEETECLKCGCTGRAIVCSNYRSSEMQSLRQQDLLYVYRPSVKNPEILTCTVIYLLWYFSREDPVNTDPLAYVDARYLFIPGQGGVYAARPHKLWMAMFYNGNVHEYEHYNVDPRHEPLEIHKTCKDRLGTYSNSSNINVLVSQGELEDYMAGTPMQYAYDVYNGWIDANNHIDMLDKLYKWPKAMEQLGKIGLTYTIVHARANNEGLNTTFNMRAGNVKKMLKCNFTKDDMKYLLHTQNVIYTRDIKRYQKLRKSPMAKGITFHETVDLGGCWGVETILKYVQLKKAMTYADRQGSNLNTYADYLRDCEKLEMDLTSKSVLFPKNLERLHVELQDQIKHKTDELSKKKWEKRYKECVYKYSYTGKDYCIVVPAKLEDLVREGKDMHNCVGSYMIRVADGDTDVVYIRKRDALEESFGTMEICNDKIIQARGKYNNPLPPDVMAFVEEFKRDMLTPQSDGRKDAV